MRPLRVQGLMLALLFLTLSAAAPAAKRPAHDFHVSITQVDYNPGAGSLEVAVKLFTDDLEAALMRRGAPNLQLGSRLEHEKARHYLSLYLDEHLHFTVNGKEYKGEYLGKEVEYDVTWCYIELKKVPAPKEIAVRNSLLTDQFGDQSNIMHFHVGDAKKSLFLNAGTATGTVAF